MGKFKIDKIFPKALSIAIQGIRYLEAKIHKIGLSGRYNYTNLKKSLGSLYDDTAHSKNANYDRKFIKQYPGFYLIIYVNPKNNFMPRCLIELHPRGSTSPKEYKQFLVDLEKALPDMTLSKVEYAIDQYCSTPEKCESLYSAEVRNLFVPYQRSEVRPNTQITTFYGNRDRINRVCHFTKNQKIYERGRDDKKLDEGWSFETLDRVRLEHTALRDELKRHGLNTLRDFIDDPKLSAIIGNRWKFKAFKFKTLPKPWQYKSRDLQRGCFQTEYQQKRKTVKNISQYTKSIPEFAGLESRIRDEAFRFNDLWGI
jgi:hypothetical protein